MSNRDFYFVTEGLTVGYGGKPLIRDIEISLKRGEILTLIGPNGAGKTTVLKSILRQLEPIGGTVCLDKEIVASMSANELAKKMSVVLTRRMMTEMMSCEDVVETGRYPYTGHFGILSKEDKKIVKQAMELVHVTELKDKDFKKISDGQKQRVMLARALCQEPEIILLDEPTSYLDVKYKLEFLSILQKMSREKNLTVIMSLHELELAERVSDKILCIKGDKVDRFGSPDEIFTPGYIPELYQMTTGCYDELTGSVELEPVKGTPKVFVIGGNGKATSIYRKLQRDGIPFATGIVWENDIDFPSAKALSCELISQKAFCPIEQSHVDRCKELIKQCEIFICPKGLLEDGEYNRQLVELYNYAEKLGKIVSKVV